MSQPENTVPSNANGSISVAPVHPPPAALPELCARVHEKIERFLREEPKSERLRSVQQQSRISLQVIEEALDKYKLEDLSLSYNGGKDCLVLLILYLSALHTHARKHPTTTTLPQTLQSVYILSQHPFTEVDTFVDASVTTYHLSLARYAKSMKEAFSNYLTDHPNIKAILVGTRRTDPHGANLKHFDPTDKGWPAFMRVHPVIDWHYAEIWTFIRELGIPYCGLYDLGYTSLGGTRDTHPNPALRREGEEYRPAYELVADEEERLGRDL